MLAGAAAGVSMPAAAQAQQQSDCDRECLIALADAYAEALIADEPAAVQWPPEAVVVENLAPISAGENRRVNIADPVTGSSGA